MNFNIRTYCQGDEFKINAMFNEVFTQNRDINHWYWKYRDNPYGSYCISIAVSDDGTLVAHFAGYPIKLCFYHKYSLNAFESIIYHMGDKMTQNRFRSVGFGKSALITRTFFHFKETFTAVDTAFLYGFVTRHSLRFGLLFLDYIAIEKVPYRRLNFDKLSGIAVRTFNRFLQHISVSVVSEIDEAWSDFFHSVAPYYNYLIKRDAAYLRWKYLQRPDKEYLILLVKKWSKITGWAVFCRDGDKIVWGDALFEPNDTDSVRAILHYLYRYVDVKGVSFIECWFSSRPLWWDAILRSLEFSNETEPNNLHFCIHNGTDDATPGRLADSFYYTMGDSDLF